jgi:Zn-dependent metalloprotease
MSGIDRIFDVRLSSVISLVGLWLMAGQAFAVEKIDLRQLPVTAGAVQNLNARGYSAAPPETLARTLVTEFGLPAEEGFVLARKSETPSGMNHLHFNQTFRNIPVWGERVIVSRNKSNQIVRINGTLVRSMAADVQDVTPAFDKKTAIERAKDNVRRQVGLAAADIDFSNESARLVIFVRPADHKARLSYEVTFFAIINRATGEATRPVFIIDAKTGQTLYRYENLQTAEGTGPGGNQKTGKYRYGPPSGQFPPYEVEESGSTCSMSTPNVTTENLNHATSGSGTPFSFQCFENTVQEINGAFSPLNDAHYFGNIVFRLYNDWYGTKPLTQKLLLQVHFGNNFENAHWNGTAMQFGDGANKLFPLVSLDVVAHEVSHGFTAQHSALIYVNQSGGINEAFSDMAGEAAESFNNGGNPPDFLVGSTIPKQQGAALRFMCEPSKDGRSIESANNYNDGLDVHFSSGVYNKAFCLLAKTCGWDTRKAFDVFLTANRDYWTPSTNFIQGGQGVVDAATDLGYPTQDVVNAFAAVDIIVGVPVLASSLNVIKILKHPDENQLRLFNLQCDGVTKLANVNAGASGPQPARAGNHTVSEAVPLGDFSTVIGGDCAADGTITLAEGDSKICMITNYDHEGGCAIGSFCCEPGQGTEACRVCRPPNGDCP